MKPVGGAKIRFLKNSSDDLWLHHPMNAKNRISTLIFTLYFESFGVSVGNDLV